MAVDPLVVLLHAAAMSKRRPREDEPGWDPRTMGNRHGGPLVAGPAGPIVHHHLRRGPMDPLLRPDGPPIHPVLGGGYPQHPLLWIYKHRARRTVA